MKFSFNLSLKQIVLILVVVYILWKLFVSKEKFTNEDLKPLNAKGRNNRDIRLNAVRNLVLKKSNEEKETFLKSTNQTDKETLLDLILDVVDSPDRGKFTQGSLNKINRNRNHPVRMRLVNDELRKWLMDQTPKCTLAAHFVKGTTELRYKQDLYDAWFKNASDLEKLQLYNLAERRFNTVNVQSERGEDPSILAKLFLRNQDIKIQNQLKSEINSAVANMQKTFEDKQTAQTPEEIQKAKEEYQRAQNISENKIILDYWKNLYPTYDICLDSAREILY